MKKALRGNFKRCSWVDLNSDIYIEYHDNEWGVPVHDDDILFEMLVLIQLNYCFLLNQSM